MSKDSFYNLQIYIFPRDSESFNVRDLLAAYDHRGRWLSPVLWENQGTSRLIPASVVQNAHREIKDANERKKHYPVSRVRGSIGRITWEQGVPISPLAIQALLAAARETGE